MNRIVFALASLALSTVSLACSTPDDSVDGSEDQLINAPLDKTNTWAVGVCASEPNTDPAVGPLGACTTKGTRCTGSLIAPNLVLTARHCVADINYDNATGFCDGAVFEAKLKNPKIRVTLDASVLGENVAWREAAEVILENENNGCKNDLAILRLAAPVAAADAKPIALDTRGLAKIQPRKVAVVGRGVLTALFDLETGAPIDEANGGLKRRFKTDMSFDCVSNNSKKPCIVDDYSSPPTNKFALPFDAYFATGPGTASGDSGAAVLSSAKFKAGKPVAIGVISAGTWDKNGVDNHSINVRLDQHEAWLKATLKAKAPNAYTLVTSGSTDSAE